MALSLLIEQKIVPEYKNNLNSHGGQVVRVSAS